MGVTLPRWLFQALFQTQGCLFLAVEMGCSPLLSEEWLFPILPIYTSPMPQRPIVLCILLT